MNQPERILILQLKRIGDVVLTLPVIGVLKKIFPKAKVDFLVEKPADELVRLNPYIDETLVYEKERSLLWLFEIRRRKYDLVLDFLSNGRSLILTLLSKAREKIGFSGPLTRSIVYTRTVKPNTNQFIVEQKMDLLNGISMLQNQVHFKNWSWDLNLPSQKLLETKEQLKKEGINYTENLIGFSPAHRRAVRAWIPERFAETAESLGKRGFRILFLGGPGEEKYLEKIANNVSANVVIHAATNLIELSAWISFCKILIANDNGPQKIALALGIPTVTIFGPTDPKSICPNDPIHRTIRDENLFCIGCQLNRCPYNHECMKNITAEMALKEIKGLLKNISEANSAAQISL